jgi:polyribonucleotide nucleotidyltransferase
MKKESPHAFIQRRMQEQKAMSEIIQEVIGKTVAEANEICERNNMRSRISFEDGEAYMGTCDYDPNRLSFSVEKGIVKGANTG